MVNADIQRQINTNNTADIPVGIALNNSTSVTLMPANLRRVNFTLSNPSNQQVWIKFQAASVDDDKKGIALLRGGFYEMSPDNMYIGEVSAIAENGTPTVYPLEF